VSAVKVRQREYPADGSPDKYRNQNTPNQAPDDPPVSALERSLLVSRDPLAGLCTVQWAQTLGKGISPAVNHGELSRCTTLTFQHSSARHPGFRKVRFEGREVTRFEVIRYSVLLVAGQCSIGGAGVPSDQSCTTTMKVVTRDCGSFAAIIGEPGRFAPQFFATSPGA
jgi:hypothetical protein